MLIISGLKIFTNIMNILIENDDDKEILAFAMTLTNKVETMFTVVLFMFNSLRLYKVIHIHILILMLIKQQGSV